MTLTWMPPRKIKHFDETYRQVKHWLVNQDGRILASVIEPAVDNPEDSFDARLHYTNKDDTGYFISLEHAQEWCQRRSLEDQGKEKPEPDPVALGVVTETK